MRQRHQLPHHLAVEDSYVRVDHSVSKRIWLVLSAINKRAVKSGNNRSRLYWRVFDRSGLDRSDLTGVVLTEAVVIEAVLTEAVFERSGFMADYVTNVD